MTTLAAISLTTPVMLAGLTLLSLPLIAHLLNRRATRRVVFPTLVLLQASAASQAQLFRMRRWLLLLLRMLAIAFIVLAFARPMWIDSPITAAGPHDRVAVILVMDVSASVAQQADGISAMHLLKVAADRALAGLSVGHDHANIIIASARPQKMFDRLTANLPALREQLATLEVVPERADLAGALMLAGEQLAAHDGPRRMVILTDLQATNWSNIESKLAGSDALPSDVHMTLVPLHLDAPMNVALHEPRVTPAAPVMGQTVELSTQVTNYSDDARVVNAAIYDADRDEQLGTLSVTLQPWQQQQVTLEHRFPEPGDYRIRFELPEDGLRIDNRAYLAVTVREQVTIVLVGDDSPQSPGSGSYFLQRAIAPHGDTRDRYTVRHLTSDHVRWHRLHDAAAVMISNITALDAAALDSFVQYLNQGGSIMLFSESDAMDAHLAALDEALAVGGSPWRAHSSMRTTTLDDYFTLHRSGAFDSPWLRVFDQPSRDAMTTIPFYQRWQVDQVHDETRVLLRFADDLPALAVREAGERGGQLIVVNFGVSLHASELGRFGFLVAFIHNITQQLQTSVLAGSDAMAGEALTVHSARPMDIRGSTPRLIGPDDQTLGMVDITPAGDMVSATISRATQPGFYTLKQGDDTLGLAAVNIDPRESDLRRLPANELLTTLEAHGMRDARVYDLAGNHDILQLRGKPLWGWLLAAGLLMLCMEMALLAYWRR